MKLWLTTTENKYFVKMLWHLLGKCIKATVLLVCSICTVHRFFFFFFSKSLIGALFSTVFLHCSNSIFHCSSTVPFWLATFFFFFWTVATVPSGTVATFFFLSLPFVLFFFYIYCYIDTTNFTIFSRLLRCQFLINQNKIIKYETVTNHNWK